jgi:hypothetical protein
VGRSDVRRDPGYGEALMDKSFSLLSRTLFEARSSEVRRWRTHSLGLVSPKPKPNHPKVFCFFFSKKKFFLSS